MGQGFFIEFIYENAIRYAYVSARHTVRESSINENTNRIKLGDYYKSIGLSKARYFNESFPEIIKKGQLTFKCLYTTSETLDDNDLFLCVIKTKLQQDLIPYFKYPEDFKDGQIGEKYGVTCRYLRGVEFTTGIINGNYENKYVLDNDAVPTCSGGPVANGVGIIGIMNALKLPTLGLHKREDVHRKYLYVIRQYNIASEIKNMSNYTKTLEIIFIWD